MIKIRLIDKDTLDFQMNHPTTPMLTDSDWAAWYEKCVAEALEIYPIKLGEWIKINYYSPVLEVTFPALKCSNCEYIVEYFPDDIISDTNFCPNCGANMKGAIK